LLTTTCGFVVVAPALTLPEDWADKVILQAGKSKIYAVPFVGFPEPKIAWTYNGTPDLPKTVTTKADSKTITVSMKSIVRADRGVYTVSVSNCVGGQLHNLGMILVFLHFG